jgi:hypothetical protein
MLSMSVRRPMSVVLSSAVRVGSWLASPRSLHTATSSFVKTHITHLFQKLEATDRVQLAIVAFHAGLPT